MLGVTVKTEPLAEHFYFENSRRKSVPLFQRVNDAGALEPEDALGRMEEDWEVAGGGEQETNR